MREGVIAAGGLGLALHYVISTRIPADMEEQKTVIALLLNNGAHLPQAEYTMHEYLQLVGANTSPFITSIILDQAKNHHSSDWNWAAIHNCFLSSRVKAEDGMEFMEQLVAHGFDINSFKWEVGSSTSLKGAQPHLSVCVFIVIYLSLRNNCVAWCDRGRRQDASGEVVDLWS